VVICLGQGADLHMAQLIPLPLTISCSSKFRLVLLSWFSFLVPAHPGSPRQSPGGHEMVVVVVVVVVVVASASDVSRPTCNLRLISASNNGNENASTMGILSEEVRLSLNDKRLCHCGQHSSSCLAL